MKAILGNLMILLRADVIWNSHAPEQQTNTDKASADTSAKDASTQAKTTETVSGTSADTPAEKILDSIPQEKQTEKSANTELKNILGQKIQYKVSYDVTAAGTASKMTQYISGSKIRIDTITQGFEIRSYLLDKEFNSCNKITGDWMCQKIDYKQSDFDKTQEDAKANVEKYDVQSTGTKVVAGVTTSCYRITVKDGIVDYCYSPDYVPLYVKTTAGQASSELTATSYSTSVSEADFALPAQAKAVNPEDYLKNAKGFN